MRKLFLFVPFLVSVSCPAQSPPAVPTHADTLRGRLTPERTWWDVQRYDITIRPDYLLKSTAGSDLITYKVVSKAQPGMQLDLQAPLHIDSIVYNGHERL